MGTGAACLSVYPLGMGDVDGQEMGGGGVNKPSNQDGKPTETARLEKAVKAAMARIAERAKKEGTAQHGQA